MLDQRQGWMPAGKLGQDALEGRLLSFDLDQHAPRLVLDESAQVQAQGQVVREGPEPDPLDDATSQNRSALHDRLRTLPRWEGDMHAVCQPGNSVLRLPTVTTYHEGRRAARV
jgi:hypothetical protein